MDIEDQCPNLKSLQFKRFLHFDWQLKCATNQNDKSANFLLRMDPGVRRGSFYLTALISRVKYNSVHQCPIL